MAGDAFVQHFVCTHDEARRLIESYDQYYVSNCGCRERKGGCSRSRMDVCLFFNPDFPATGAGVRQITIDEVRLILEEAESKHLVTRPFRNQQDRTILDGICFCCDDCCSYFTADVEPCDKGNCIENTAMDDCTGCGVCIDACYFKARAMDEGALVIDRDKCYGCGLCIDTCPASCISMMPRHISD